MCKVRPRGMFGGSDTNVAICVIKPKNFVPYEHKFLGGLLLMTEDNANHKSKMLNFIFFLRMTHAFTKGNMFYKSWTRNSLNLQEIVCGCGKNI